MCLPPTTTVEARSTTRHSNSEILRDTEDALGLAQRALAAATVENQRLQRALDHLEPVAEDRLVRLRDAGTAKVQAADTARAHKRKTQAALTDARRRVTTTHVHGSRCEAALQHSETMVDQQHQLFVEQQLASKTKHRAELAAARLRVAGLQADVRTLQRHNRELARATAEAAEPIIVRVATLLGLDVGAASACLRRGGFRVSERAGDTTHKHKQRCARVAAEVMWALFQYACPFEYACLLSIGCDGPL